MNEYANLLQDKRKQNIMEPYRCPVNGCNKMYHWRGQKWNYKYIDNQLFDQIRDETLLKYLPTDIENIIIDFICN